MCFSPRGASSPWNPTASRVAGSQCGGDAVLISKEGDAWSPIKGGSDIPRRFVKVDVII